MDGVGKPTGRLQTLGFETKNVSAGLLCNYESTFSHHFNRLHSVQQFSYFEDRKVNLTLTVS